MREQSKKSACSFAELEDQERPKARSVLETLRDYAESGSAICPRVVLGVIDRACLNASQLGAAKTHAQRGYETQIKRCEEKSAEEYRLLIREIDCKLVS